MSGDGSQLDSSLLHVMEEATKGNRESLESFYKLFLTSQFLVPLREQTAPLSHQPKYPNDFFQLLGIKGGDKSWLPIFTGPTALNEWMGQELAFNTLTGAEILEKVPADWWIALNPSSETSKEFSPWEIQALRGGEDGIKDAVEDQLPTLVLEREYSALNDNYSELIDQIKLEAKKEPAIEKIRIALEIEKDAQGNSIHERIIIGATCTQTTTKGSADKIKEKLGLTAQRCLIGSSEFEVVVGLGEGALSTGMLKTIKPLYIKTKNRTFGVTEFIFLGLLALYSFFFFRDLKPFWFNHLWTTDDALQQVYPFHEALNPGVFTNDLPTEVMKGYLAPLHYWLSWGVTKVTGNVIIMSHVVMTLQLALTLMFLFLAVRAKGGIAPALFAVTWFLHTRPVIQRMTGGLPRGWAAPVLAAFLWAFLTDRHKAVIAILVLGCLLHPPATFVACIAYGSFLLWKLANKELAYRKPFIHFIAACPVILLIVAFVVHRPDSIGQMVDFATASMMPEFQWPNGRFPFLPFPSPIVEFQFFAFQPFISRLFEPAVYIQNALPLLIVGLCGILPLLGRHFKKEIVPSRLWFFLLAAALSYFAARIFAFKLYVPNRHLQFPMSLFLITAFSIGIGTLGALLKEKYKLRFGALLIAGLISGLVWIGSDTGLVGSSNFNFWAYKKGNAFRWLSNNSSNESLVAGHPTHINGVPLFAGRKAFATTEIAHPFYPKYYEEIRRRLIISLRAHYSTSLKEIYELLKPEGVNYFVFSRKRFSEKALKNEKYFSPLDILVHELTARTPEEYAFSSLLPKVDLTKQPFLVFRDQESAIIDVNALGRYLGKE